MSADQRQQQQQQQRRGSDVFLGVGCRERDEDEQSIIDVFEFDDTAHDRWLCSLGNRSRRSSLEAAKVEDLDAWLHADVAESDAVQSDNNARRSSIDSRTFTRIKRRSNRLNFGDAAEATVSPETSSFSLSNVWKNKTIPESNEQVFNNNNNDKGQSDRRDSIPMMLRPKTNQVLAALLSESPSSISSQTSMEAFMSVARRDSSNFLLKDVSDPDLSSVLMNISQPSLLYSSIISDGKGEDNVQQQQQSILGNIESSMIDSQILTDSMMEASMFKEVQDTTVLAEFLKQNNDVTVIEDQSFNFDDKTFVNDNLIDRTYIDINDKESKSCDATFVAKSNDTYAATPSPTKEAVSANSTRIISSPILNTTRTVVNSPTSLNSTQVISSKPESHRNDVLSTTQTLSGDRKTDLTFDIESTSSPPVAERLDATFQTSGGQRQPRLSGSSNGGNPSPLDATFNAIPPLRAELLKEVRRSSGNKLNSTFSPNSPKKMDVTYDRPSSAESPLFEAESLDATYVSAAPSIPKPESPAKTSNLGATFSAMTLSSKLSNPAGSERTRNLVESQSNLPDPNRFNTFRKDSKLGSRLSRTPQAQEQNHAPPAAIPPPQSQVPNVKCVDNSYQQRYKTFSRKTGVAKDQLTAVSPSKSVAPEVKAKEEKQFEKPQIRQIPPPRRLSKLPQMFQKSNPNLGSNAKQLRGGRMSMNVGAIGFCKGSQPNISSNVQPQALSRFKSERLLPRKPSTEFSTSDGTSHSMESIDSNGSAHSAPDLDDGRSVASDSSRASYTIKPRHLDLLPKSVGMGKFNGSTPKVKDHQVLKNNWVQDRDLPSPILKNGISKSRLECDSRSTSPTDSTEFSAKTSSPLTNSPSNSDHTINTISDSGIEAAKENIQARENVKPTQQIKVPNTNTGNKGTMLRRPSNWAAAANKASNGVSSGIPRPASRIPAPRFARPNQK